MSRIRVCSKSTDNSLNGTGVEIYVVDTGIDVGHVEFSRRNRTNAFWAYTSQRLKSTGDVDKNGHGTHLAGTVAGETTGVAPGAEVHAVKACHDDGRCSLFDLIESVTWVCGPEFKRLQEVTGLARPKVQRGHYTLHRLHMNMMLKLFYH